MMKKIALMFIIVITALFTFTGCTPEINSVSTDGSTAMEKTIGMLGEVYESETGISVTYNPTGSGTGVKAVADGRCDIGLSSRRLKDDEIEKGLKGTILAYDGIAVIVNPQNPIDDLDIETIAKIYTGEITNWSEIGGNNGEIVLIGREAGSGTRDGFESVTGTNEKCRYRQELTSTGDVITTVSQNPNAIGYTSLASVKESVNVLKVGGVYPTEETIKDGSYVVQRPFILVTSVKKPLNEKSQGFYDYMTSEEAHKWILKSGIVPAIS